MRIRLGGEGEVVVRLGDGEGNAGNWQRGEETLSESGSGVGEGLALQEKEGGREGERHREMVG